MRRPPWWVVLPLVVVGLVWLVTSRRDGNAIDPERTARTMLQDELVRQDSAAAIRDVSCVKQQGREYQCVVTLYDRGSEERVAGTLLCDEPGGDAQCLWRGQLAGG